MAIITLTSDFGNSSHYVASLKGSILSNFDNVNIVDISHEIPPFDKIQTSYIIKNCYRDFPKNTVHIIAVESEFHQKNKPLVCIYDQQYFICADNGILSLIFEDEFIKNTYVIKTDKKNYQFTAKEVFVDFAVKILKEEKINYLIEKTHDLHIMNNFKPYVQENKINGCIIHIDSYGNCISNITRSFFDDNKRSDTFGVNLKKQYIRVKNFYESYSEIKNHLTDINAEPFCMFNDNGLLEISMYGSNPHKNGAPNTLLGMEIQDEIEVIFL